MAEWQENELAGITNIAYIVAMHADNNREEADPADLDIWQQQHGFQADAMLMDNDRTIIDAYIAANPGQQYTQAITVIFDKNMEIRHVGGTYDAADDSNLDLLLQLSAE